MDLLMVMQRDGGILVADGCAHHHLCGSVKEERCWHSDRTYFEIVPMRITSRCDQIIWRHQEYGVFRIVLYSSKLPRTSDRRGLDLDIYMRSSLRHS